jgi:hypothetical protein
MIETKRKNMNRRGFITIMAAGGCFVFYPSIFNGCSAAVDAQNLNRVDLTADDIRLKLISYAMLAPSSHNIQPWLVKLTEEDRFDLYVDPSRLLPESDPPSRQTHISQGAFLEYLKIAASGLGVRAEIDHFPQGLYGNDVVENKPVASIRLVADVSVPQDPFFPWLQIRQSNKRVYDKKQIPPQILDELRRQAREKDLTTELSDSGELVSALGAMIGKAMAIETAGAERHKELVDVFRFSEEEALRFRDGFSLANNGVTGFKRALVETFFLGTKEKAYATDASFAKEGIKMAYRQAESAAAYGWIVSETNTRLDQVQAGERYTRINLLTARQGIGQHPMSQILAEYEEMNELQQEFLELLRIPRGATVQMIFRLGYADPVPYTKRRFPRDMVA